MDNFPVVQGKDVFLVLINALHISKTMLLPEIDIDITQKPRRFNRSVYMQPRLFPAKFPGLERNVNHIRVADQECKDPQESNNDDAFPAIHLPQECAI